MKTKVKIIFLDIDGVLVHYGYALRFGADGTIEKADPVCVRHLNLLIKHTGADIVLSSQWRTKSCDIDLINYTFGLEKKILDITPIHMDSHRGREIMEWCSRHNTSINECLVIDDRTDDIHGTIPEDRIIYVKHGLYENGLQLKHIERFLD